MYVYGQPPAGQYIIIEQISHGTLDVQHWTFVAEASKDTG